MSQVRQRILDKADQSIVLVAKSLAQLRQELGGFLPQIVLRACQIHVVPYAPVSGRWFADAGRDHRDPDLASVALPSASTFEMFL